MTSSCFRRVFWTIHHDSVSRSPFTSINTWISNEMFKLYAHRISRILHKNNPIREWTLFLIHISSKIYLLNSENNNNIHFIPLSPWIKSNMNYERKFSQIQCVTISFTSKTSVHAEKFHSFTHIANIFHGEGDWLLFNEKDGHNINPIEWNELCANYWYHRITCIDWKH